MTKIKSCPWCGSDDQIVDKQVSGMVTQFTMFKVVCMCGAAGPDHPAKKKAIAEWNRVATLAETATVGGQP